MFVRVLERALTHFPGAVVVVSPDRFFIDQVATRILVLEGEGVVNEIAGNWTIWQAGLVQSGVNTTTAIQPLTLLKLPYLR